MDHVMLLREYGQRLHFHSWEAVEDLIHDNAVFVFSDGTFRGKQEIAQAFRKTFAIIQDETYTIQDVEWLVEKDTVAVCVYTFQWTGTIHGKYASGEGRGTTVIVQTAGGWKIMHEHLGPPPR